MITIHMFVHSFTDLLKYFWTPKSPNLLGNRPPVMQFCCCTSGVWCRKNVVIPVMGDSANHRIIEKQSQTKTFAGFPGKLSKNEPVTHVKREGFRTELASKLSFFPATNDGKSLKSSDFLPDEIPPWQVMHCDLASHLALGHRPNEREGCGFLGKGWCVSFLGVVPACLRGSIVKNDEWSCLEGMSIMTVFVKRTYKCIASKLVPGPTLAIKWLGPSLNCCWRIPDGIYLRITPATTDNQTAKLPVMSNFYKVWFPVPFWSK